MRIAALSCVIVAAALGPVAALAGDGASKKSRLIEAMQGNGCMMTTAQANVQMPKLGIDRTTAIKLSREMMAEGVVTFADDEETLLLLPPACKS